MESCNWVDLKPRSWKCSISVVVFFSGRALLDLMLRCDEPPPSPGKRVLCRHPFDEAKRAYVCPSHVEKLYHVFWKEGKVSNTLADLRWYKTIWHLTDVKTFSNWEWQKSVSTCASCNACYVGETCRHLSTRIREHLFLFSDSMSDMRVSGQTTTRLWTLVNCNCRSCLVKALYWRVLLSFCFSIDLQSVAAFKRDSRTS